jgi:hypothetical protein
MSQFAYRMRTALLTQRSYLPCVRSFRLRPPNLKLQGGRARRNRRLPHKPDQFCKPMTKRLTKWPSAPCFRWSRSKSVVMGRARTIPAARGSRDNGRLVRA